MALLTPRRRAWTAIGVITGLAALSTGAWALHRWQPFADEQATITWPHNIEPLADYVESTARLQFLRPVPIEFVPDAAEFAHRAGLDRSLTAEQRALATDNEALGRALGLWSGDTTIDEPPSGTADRTALWLSDEGVLVVRGWSGYTVLGLDEQAEVVGELTRALDQQQFDTAMRAATAHTAQSRLVVQALDLGHARWMTDEYMADNGSLDFPSFGPNPGPGGDTTDIDPLPRGYVTLQTAPTVIGAEFVEAMYETKRHFVADAFTSALPDAIDQMVQPATRYLRRDPLEQADPPATPLGGEVIGERQLGHTGLFLVLATGLSAEEALTAADGWGNDAATMYRLDGRVCVDLHVVADSRDDADRIEHGLERWAGSRPKESDARVGRKGLDLFATACDPGAKVHQRVAADGASDLYLSRVEAIRTLANLTGRADVAECMAVRYYQDHRDPIFAWDLEADPSGELAQLRDECRASLP